MSWFLRRLPGCIANLVENRQYSERSNVCMEAHTGSRASAATGRTRVEEIVLFLVAEQSKTAVFFSGAVSAHASDRVVSGAGADLGRTGVGRRED